MYINEAEVRCYTFGQLRLLETACRIGIGAGREGLVERQFFLTALMSYREKGAVRDDMPLSTSKKQGIDREDGIYSQGRLLQKTSLFDPQAVRSCLRRALETHHDTLKEAFGEHLFKQAVYCATDATPEQIAA